MRKKQRDREAFIIQMRDFNAEIELNKKRRETQLKSIETQRKSSHEERKQNEKIEQKRKENEQKQLEYEQRRNEDKKKRKEFEKMLDIKMKKYMMNKCKKIMKYERLKYKNIISIIMKMEAVKRNLD